MTLARAQDAAADETMRPLVRRLLSNDNAVLLQTAGPLFPDVAFRTIGAGDASRIVVNGRECVMLASNDYLGLRQDPRVIEASVAATTSFGAGASSSRLVAGSTRLHHELEEELADWLGQDAALVYTSGYQANVGALSSLSHRRTTAICDRGVHASLLDGCRLGGARIRRFDRARPDSLPEALQRLDDPGKAIVVTDAIYSMDGDTLPLDDVVRSMANAAEAVVVVDEAHALGTTGPHGAGVTAGAVLGSRVDVVTGNLSKSLASCGGYVAGDRAMVEALRATSRSLIFSTASTPGAIGAALCALRIARSEPERREHAHVLASRLREGLRALGFSTGASDSLIVPAIVGSEMPAIELAQGLMERGICVGYAVSPAVARGQAILRFSVTAALTREDVDRSLELLEGLVLDASGDQELA